jgi:hypothetical protein
MFWCERERVRNLCRENHEPLGGKVSSFELLRLRLLFFSFFFFVSLNTISRATKLGENKHFKLLFDYINMLQHTFIFGPELILS